AAPWIRPHLRRCRPRNRPQSVEREYRLPWHALCPDVVPEVSMRAGIVVGLFVAFAAASPRAQGPPPVTGTVALEGTMTKFYKGVNTLVVTTVDGMQHVYRFTKGLVVHGGSGSGSGVDALESVHDGTTV